MSRVNEQPAFDVDIAIQIVTRDTREYPSPTNSAVLRQTNGSTTAVFLIRVAVVIAKHGDLARILGVVQEISAHGDVPSDDSAFRGRAELNDVPEDGCGVNELTTDCSVHIQMHVIRAKRTIDLTIQRDGRRGISVDICVLIHRRARIGVERGQADVIIIQAIDV